MRAHCQEDRTQALSQTIHWCQPIAFLSLTWETRGGKRELGKRQELLFRNPEDQLSGLPTTWPGLPQHGNKSESQRKRLCKEQWAQEVPARLYHALSWYVLWAPKVSVSSVVNYRSPSLCLPRGGQRVR